MNGPLANRKRSSARVLHGLLHAFTVNPARAAERRPRELTVKQWRSMKENMKELLRMGPLANRTRSSARVLHGLLHAFTVNPARAAERRPRELTVKEWSF